MKKDIKEDHFAESTSKVNEAKVGPFGNSHSIDENANGGSIVNWILQNKESDYCTYKTITLSVSTFNVNGQSPCTDLFPLVKHSDDTSPDMYIFGFQELDLSQQAFLFDYTVREEEWARVVCMNLFKIGSYFELKRVRLVGIFMLVYISESLYYSKTVSDLDVTVVPTGLLNRWGNKGAVAVRFRVHDSTFCLVNCHFASGVEELERRNQDYREISRAVFSNLPTGQNGLFDHDYVFWFGDMNYRLHNAARQMIESIMTNHPSAYLPLLQRDQLNCMREKGLIFQDFKEGSINFQPTYKYDKGVDRWDSSEKFRAPAWCDRILWCGDKIEQIAYESIRDLRFSDHRPVRATFNVQTKIIDENKLKVVYEAALKESDRLENEWLPQVALDRLEFHFEDVQFLQPQCQTLTITNTGRVPVHFEFQPKFEAKSFCKSWILVTPDNHKIKVGDKCHVDIQLLIDKETIWAINEGREDLVDILVLHLKRSKDFFITVNATYVKTCFGMSLEELVKVVQPIREIIPTGNLLNLDVSPRQEEKTTPSLVPKEICRIVTHIRCNGLKQENLFAQAGFHAEFLSIRDALDTGYPEEIPGDINSAAEALLRLFDSLPEPLIPLNYTDSCLQNAADCNACKQVVAKFPASHRATLCYLIKFLKEVVENGQWNGCTASTLGYVFAPILFRFKDVSESCPKLLGSKRLQFQESLTAAAKFLVTLLQG